MFVKQVKIKGTEHLCVVTTYEKSRLNAGQKVTIPACRLVALRLGIPRSMQLHAAGISAPPIVF